MNGQNNLFDKVGRGEAWTYIEVCARFGGISHECANVHVWASGLFEELVTGCIGCGTIPAALSDSKVSHVRFRMGQEGQSRSWDFARTWARGKELDPHSHWWTGRRRGGPPLSRKRARET